MANLGRNHLEHRYEATLADGRRIAVDESEIEQSLLYARKEGMDEDEALKDILEADHWVQYVGAPGRRVTFVPSPERLKEIKQQQAQTITGTFLGRSLETIHIAGLVPGLKTRKREGQTIQVLTLSDEDGVKWELRYPWLVHRDPHQIALFHRSGSWGRKFHAQRQSEAGTRGGLHQLLEYVSKHEDWERAGRPDKE